VSAIFADHINGIAVLEYGSTEILPPVGLLFAAPASLCRPCREPSRASRDSRLTKAVSGERPTPRWRERVSRQAIIGRRNSTHRRSIGMAIFYEKRLRDNLAAVGHDTALYKQTLDKLGETEATISTLSSAIAKGTDEIEAAKEQLQVFVSSLTLAYLSTIGWPRPPQTIDAFPPPPTLRAVGQSYRDRFYLRPELLTKPGDSTEPLGGLQAETSFSEGVWSGPPLPPAAAKLT
jgi:hypothetical protein